MSISQDSTMSHSTAELVERLRRQAETASDTLRHMAEEKSLRQAGHNPPRNDLYMWPTPEQTIYGQAATRLEHLERALKPLADSVLPEKDTIGGWRVGTLIPHGAAYRAHELLYGPNPYASALTQSGNE